MTSETGADGSTEGSDAGAMPPVGMAEPTATAPGAEMPVETAPPVEGRRTQLKVVRESLESLTSDVWKFRRSHDFSTKRLEKEVASLRSQLAAQAVAKDLGSFRKSHEAGTKRLERQVATLRKELATMKSQMAKDAAKSRAKQEATLSRILAKVSSKPSKPAKATKPAKRSKKR